MTHARTFAIAAAAVAGLGLVAAARRTSAGPVESASVWGVLDPLALSEGVESIMNRITQAPANVGPDVAARNERAFLSMLREAEGTARAPDPYRVCYGYGHTIADLSDHPAITGEWRGEKLPDSMCRNAGFGPGCVSTAAGAYQLIKPTWVAARRALGLADFSPASQDAAALHLVAQRGALEDVRAGRLAQAVHKVRAVWASLPGNYAGQGQRSWAQLSGWFERAGGGLLA